MSTPFETYPTPAWCVTRLLERVVQPLDTSGLWLEPCAGEGAIVAAVNAVFPSIRWNTIDIRPECNVTHPGDFLTLDVPPLYTTIVTNPPFTLAVPFIKKALRVASSVVVLLPMELPARHKHADFFRENTPDVYILPNRPGFIPNSNGKRGTARSEYIWCHWHPGLRDRLPIVRVLEDTPVGERK